MPGGRDIRFVFYLLDTGTGLCYYKDAGGNVSSMPISSAMKLNQKYSPDGWMNQELGFTRNMHYYGTNRSYSIPMKLVNDAALIVRTLMNRGRGIEVPLTMVVYKYDPNPAPGDPTFEFYYRGQIDLPKSRDKVAEGVQCNLMEGGFLQLLKAREKTMYQIPCDGSIPENIKINMDGMLFEDTFNYQIIGIDGTTAGSAGVPCAFLSNEGDNAGIVHNDPSYEPIVTSSSSGDYYQTSQNHLFVSSRPVKVRIQGSITISSSVPGKTIKFSAFLATSKSVSITTFPGVSYTTGLTPAEYGYYNEVNGQQIFNFDATVSLAANERLFFMMATQNGSDTKFSLKGGNFTLKFASQYPTTYPWAITLYDLGKLLVQNICEDCSINGETYNYAFVSQLLQDNLNLVATSGDALRASGDPNYQKFYNAVQNNPNFPNVNLYYSYGPVIKTCLSDFFDAVNAILNASMSTQIREGEGETIFIEKKGYVFDASVKNIDNGEVTELEHEPAMDLIFTLIRIGYEPQSYDQKAGKYAWNTLLEMTTPIKSVPEKVLEIKCPYLADPYLIERLRADIGDTSTTRNSSDSRVFVINTDPDNYVWDQYQARFDSEVTQVNNDPGGSGNTNIRLVPKQYFQGVNMPTISGSYLTNNSTAAIFLFNQLALSAQTFNFSLAISGFLYGYPYSALTGQAADTVTLKLWINGVIVQSWTTTASSPSTTIAINLTTTRAFSFKDCIYITADTSTTATVTLTSVSLQVTTLASAAYFSATAGDITIDSGMVNQLLALPNAAPINDGNGRPVVSYGFQWFQFNSNLLNHNFDMTLLVNGMMTGGAPGQQSEFDLFLNGVPILSQSFVRTSGNQAFGMIPGFNSPTLNEDFELGDIIFMVGSAQDINVFYMNVVLQLTSTQIKARDLYRVQYDAISGLPNLLGYMTNTAVPITTGAGAPYNIEQLTPKRMLLAHGNYIRGCLFDQIPGLLQFHQLSKNEYLSTTKGGITITENSAVDISDLDAQLFKAKYIYYKTRVQEAFATIMTGAANAFVGASFIGNSVEGFPLDMKQRPATNESQQWKLLAGPNMDFNAFNNPQLDGLKYTTMKPNSLFCSFLSGVQFVPSGKVLPTKYHTYNRNQFWFVEQVNNWINRNNYWQPRQAGDPCNLQFITRDLTNVILRIYKCSGDQVGTDIPFAEKTSAGIISPYHLWELSPDLTTIDASPGGYYMTVTAGSGANTVTFISEGLLIKSDWPGTLLIEAFHSENRQDMMFDTGFVTVMRFGGFYDNMFKQQFTGAWYVNQPRDIQILNAWPYETTDLITGFQDGEPDYVHKKVGLMLVLDNCAIDGENFSIDEGAKWEETFIEGNPKKFHKITIAPSQNLMGISQDIDGFTDDSSMMISLDAQYMGPNAVNGGTGEPNIITVEINS